MIICVAQKQIHSLKHRLDMNFFPVWKVLSGLFAFLNIFILVSYDVKGKQFPTPWRSISETWHLRHEPIIILTISVLALKGHFVSWRQRRKVIIWRHLAKEKKILRQGRNIEDKINIPFPSYSKLDNNLESELSNNWGARDINNFHFLIR